MMNIYEKINCIMDSVKSLKKDGKVDYGNTKYNYLSESKTTEVFREQLIKHKLVILPTIVSEEIHGKITHGIYTYRLINADNPDEFIDVMSGGQGHDSADKGSGKASSYAYKYLLWRLFAIPSNDDPDKVSSAEIDEIEKVNKIKEEKENEDAKNSPIDNIKVKTIKSDIKNAEMTESLFIELFKKQGYKKETMEEMTLSEWIYAMKFLEKTIKSKNKNESWGKE